MKTETGTDKIQDNKPSYAVEMLNICKSFDNLKALDDVTLRVKYGEVHAILGENGAGKSTLMSILFGLKKADSGTIKVDGKEVHIANSNEATKLHIGMVHQHFKLVDVFTVFENIILGHEDQKLGFLRKKEARKKVEETLREYGIILPLDSRIKDLPVATQQKTEIAKILFLNAKIIIMDEPTAVLTPQETVGLMKVIRNFADSGKAVILITHKLNEIKMVADSVTVMRRGCNMGTFAVRDCTAEQLAELMVGRHVSFTIAKKEIPLGRPVLEIKNLSCDRKDHSKKAVDDVSLTVHAGEVVGIAAVEGNGQEELLDIVTGIDDSFPKLKGQVLFHPSMEETDQVAGPAGDVGEQMEKLKRRKRLLEKGDLTSSLAFGTTDPQKALRLCRDEIWRLKRAKKAKDRPQNIIRYAINRRIKKGIAEIPSDRQRFGLILDYDIQKNLVSKDLRKPFVKGFFIDRKKIASHADKMIAKYDIRTPSGRTTLTRNMSGGNQQKVIIARELERKPALLVSNQATRGLDVGAIEFVNKQIIKARDEGCAVLLYSTELDDLFNLSTVIYVMFNGRLIAKLDPKTADYKEVGFYMGGGSSYDGSADKGFVPPKEEAGKAKANQDQKESQFDDIDSAIANDEKPKARAKAAIAFRPGLVSLEKPLNFIRKMSYDGPTAKIFNSLTSILVGLLLGFLVMLIVKPSSALKGFQYLFTSGSRRGLKSVGNSLWKAGPLILLGLSVAIPNKGGLFNIGASGQFTFGAAFAFLVANLMGSVTSSPWLFLVVFLAGALGGAIWGFVPGILKATLNVNEVVCTIMMNWIAVYVAKIIVSLDFVYDVDISGANYSVTGANVPTWGLSSLFTNSNIDSGIIIAIGFALLSWFLVSSTKFGFKLKATGLSRDAAKGAGYSFRKLTVWSLTLGGLMAGIAGVLYYFPSQPMGYLQATSTVSNEGFDGISIALIANNNALGTIFTGIMIAWLREASVPLQTIGYDKFLVDVIMGVIIYSTATFKLASSIIRHQQLKQIKNQDLLETKRKPDKEAKEI